MSPSVMTSDFHHKLLGLQLRPVPLTSNCTNYTPPSSKTKLHENNQPLAAESLCESGSEISRTPTATTATSTPTATSCTPSSFESTPPIIEEHASHSHEKPAGTTARISKTELLILRMMLCQPILESLAMQSHQSDMLNLMLTNDRIAGAIEGTSGPRPTMQKLREWTCRSATSDDPDSHKQFACWGCGGRICTDCCYTKVIGAPPRAHQCKTRCDTCHTKHSFNTKFSTNATPRTCMCHDTQMMRFYRFQNQLQRKVCSSCMITPPQDLTRAWWAENPAKSPNSEQSCTWPGLPKCGLCGIEAGSPKQVDNHNNSRVRTSHVESKNDGGNQVPGARLRFICLGCGGFCREKVHWNQPEPNHLWYPIRYRR